MTYLCFPIRRLLYALFLNTALASGALAQSLPEIAPETIARDVDRRYDNQTGQIEYIAGSFDPFEANDTLAGSALLRSAGNIVTIDGAAASGGAYLDVALMYTSNSPDAYDARGFETALYLSGQSAGIVRYDRDTLDCSRNSKSVTYDDSYYRGASYGYIAGLYRIFPRYRGHRHFGYNRGFSRHGNYRYWPRGVNRDARRFIRDRDRDRDRDRADHTRSDRDRSDNRDNRNRDARNRDQRRDRDNLNAEERGRDRDRAREHIRDRNPDNNTPRTRGPRRGDDVSVRTPRRDRTPNTDRVARDNNESRSRRLRETEREVRPNNRARLPDAEAPPRRVTGEPRAETPRVRTPRERTPRADRPRTQTPQTRPPRTDTPRAAPRPERARPAERRAPAPTRERQSRVNHKVDQVFKGKNPREPRGNKHRNFYPMVGASARTDVFVSYRCVKEEKLTIHIPQDRLDAARFDGLTVLLVDNQGAEIPVFIPPNYIEGFRLAAIPADKPHSRSSNSYTWPPQQSTEPPTVSNAPIIYGDLD